MDAEGQSPGRPPDSVLHLLSLYGGDGGRSGGRWQNTGWTVGSKERLIFLCYSFFSLRRLRVAGDQDTARRSEVKSKRCRVQVLVPSQKESRDEIQRLRK